LIDQNNSAYVDGLFLYLSSNLIHNHGFYHGVDYYGSFLGIKNNFTLNVFDDIDYLNNSDFFNKNKNILFKIDEYEHLIKNEKQKLKSIKIDYNSSAKSSLSLKSINDEIFENLFNNTYEEIAINNSNDMIEYNFDNDNHYDNDNKTNDEINNLSTTLKSSSSSSCSSRLSYTNSEISEASENSEDFQDFQDFQDSDSSKSTEYSSKSCSMNKNESDWEDVKSNFDNNSSDSNDSSDTIVNCLLK
jgi:hypothetical protein